MPSEPREATSSLEQLSKAIPKALRSRRKTALQIDTDIIELTDSEDEAQIPGFRCGRAHTGGAGPSRPTKSLPQCKKVAAINTSKNAGKKSISGPHFPPSEDEENGNSRTTSSKMTPPDLIVGYVQSILEVLPNVDAEYVWTVLRKHYSQSQDQLLELVVHELLEGAPYLKRDQKGKRKRIEGIEEGDARGKAKGRMDYESRACSDDAFVEQLMLDFPYVPETKDEDTIECGCCFSDYPFEEMIQCPDAHLFCTSCMKTYTENLLGSHDHKIICMDQSGCKLPFPTAQLYRFLTTQLASLYERVKQANEIVAAGIAGLEECPFCDYKCVIENEQEKLFNCMNKDGGCAVVRQCKKLAHLPKSCKEMEDDKNLDGRHRIEEAMTGALMRKCPKCQQAFIKEQGCNKMQCPNINCGASSCYICRKLISGYDHFNHNHDPGQAPAATWSAADVKCPLYDSVEQRHAEEVKEAAEKAIQEYKLAHPDIDEERLKVDLPDPFGVNMLDWDR